MARPGKIFETEIRKLLQRESALVIRVPDVLGTRFISKKEADFVACSPGGHFILIEAKCTKAPTFAFSRIKPHQVDALNLVAGTKYGQAFLALNFRDYRAPGQAYLIPWNWFTDFLSVWSKKSIRKEEALTQFQKFKLKRITGGWAKQGPRLI